MKKFAVFGSLLLMVGIAFVAGRFSAGANQSVHAGKRRILYYVDPMHPVYRSDKPGIAPDCGMQLEPVYEDEDPALKLQLPLGAVYIDAEKQRLIGVRVEAVEKNTGSRLVRTTGRVVADGNRVHRIMAGAEGWVQSVQNNPEGTLVKKSEVLASLYSREFRNAEQAYLGSVASLDRLRGNNNEEDPSRSGDASMRINEEQLLSLGMGQPQIKELANTRQITLDIVLTSPIDGVVLSRNASPGQRFEKGTEFYRIADLSRVWVVAEVYEQETPYLRPGGLAQITLREEGRRLPARITDSLPQSEAGGGTVKLRLEVDNPRFILRPEMLVDVELPVHLASAVTVPVDALIDSGAHARIYVEHDEGVFEPREVETGRRFGEQVEILHGVQPGERVVVAATFLVDSESRLKTPAPVPAPIAAAKEPSGR